MDEAQKEWWNDFVLAVGTKSSSLALVMWPSERCTYSRWSCIRSLPVVMQPNLSVSCLCLFSPEECSAATERRQSLKSAKLTNTRFICHETQNCRLEFFFFLYLPRDFCENKAFENNNLWQFKRNLPYIASNLAWFPSRFCSSAYYTRMCGQWEPVNSIGRNRP